MDSTETTTADSEIDTTPAPTAQVEDEPETETDQTTTPTTTEPDPEAEPSPDSELEGPIANQGDDLVVVADLNDTDCTGLINLALELYGEPTSRENFASIEGGPIDTSLVEWAGIETTVMFQVSEEFEGCQATYVFGGPAIQVPAIVVPVITPEPEPELEEPFTDRNCSDFATQTEAQQFFEAEEARFPGDRHVLDIDNDGVACEPFFEPEPQPEPQPQPEPEGPFVDRNCNDFTTQAQAQQFFEAEGPGDPHGLDANDDGVACESLS